MIPESLQHKWVELYKPDRAPGMSQCSQCHQMTEDPRYHLEGPLCPKADTSRVFVSIVVDDLDAREDAARSRRIGGYGLPPHTIAQLLVFTDSPLRDSPGQSSAAEPS
jgi:hypothetical protein